MGLDQSAQTAVAQGLGGGQNRLKTPGNFKKCIIGQPTRNHVSTLEVQTAEKPVTMRVCGQVQIVNWGLFYPVVLPDFHGLNFA
ncbi:MAG: hypothetical protein MRZ73_06780, partial [Pseudoflavonifractor capillosus]|uniref:hypothetical protein n=1 Tax=Pseudoflavonifractor capillosus TaxID=106588 RepID=UPI0023F83241